MHAATRASSRNGERASTARSDSHSADDAGFAAAVGAIDSSSSANSSQRSENSSSFAYARERRPVGESAMTSLAHVGMSASVM